MKITLDVRKSIGKRYARHDEIGTPFAVTIDHDSITDHCVTVRERNTKQQTRLSVDKARAMIWEAYRSPWLS